MDALSSPIIHNEMLEGHFLSLFDEAKHLIERRKRSEGAEVGKVAVTMVAKVLTDDQKPRRNIPKALLVDLLDEFEVSNG